MSKDTETMADVIRASFKQSGLSIKQLSLRSGTAYASTHGLIVDDRDITIATADKLCRTLGLELIQRKKRKG